ncbi:MAG TPA: reductive dehalogenase domain-containing protein [Chloroflexota bacterium]|nr:reductive dehalogenase domain-containing protein [Chloroflexota bacterium]
MAVTIDPETDTQASPESAPEATLPQSSFPTPYLGRTVRIVGPVQNVDTNQMPHPKNSRGELGRALFNWYNNTVSNDPIQRVSSHNHTADKRNVFNAVVGRSPKGKTNRRRVPVDDPAAMTRHIKRVAHDFGADIVGIAAAHPSFLYQGDRRYVENLDVGDSHQQETPEDLCSKFPYLMVFPVAWDYEMSQAHRHHVGDAAYHLSTQQIHAVIASMVGYIQELGYTVIRGAANPQAVALASGVGELGRNGMIITKKYGARIHLQDAIMTDLPLVPGEPIDIGVEDFCKVCRKCAVTCPTNSISFEGKEVYNGVEKYKIKWLTCYKLRPYVHEYWGSCLTCVAVCPYTKPTTWWRDLGVASLSHCPIPLRPLLVRGLKALDDKFWGVVPQRRVRWLGYDSGIKPGEKACTVAGCTADHGDAGKAAAGNIGYYYPLKENTNRFVKRA